MNEERRTRTLEASHTDLECSPYCSTRGKILVVTIRCALLKLWSISLFKDKWARNAKSSQLSWKMKNIVTFRGWGRGGWPLAYIPWSVRVMDCSSFSSSSVKVRFLPEDDILFSWPWQLVIHSLWTCDEAGKETIIILTLGGLRSKQPWTPLIDTYSRLVLHTYSTLVVGVLNFSGGGEICGLIRVLYILT